MKILKCLLFAVCFMFPIFLLGCENQNMSSLSTPKELNVSNGVISFGLVEDADYYSISINDKVFSVNAKYNANVEIVDSVVHYNANKLLSYGKTYSIKVKARGDEKYDSHYTAVVEYFHTADLKAPTNVSVSSNTLVWGDVDDATNYVVKVFYETKNQTEEITSDTNYCDLSAIFQKYGSGKFQFYVKAVRVGSAQAESIYSDAVEHIYYQQLEKPIIESVYASGANLKMNVKIDDNANKITLYCDGDYRNIILNGTNINVTKSGSNLTVNLTGIFGADQFSNLKKYVFSVQAKHETILTSYFINSETSEQYIYNKTEKLTKPNLNVTYDDIMGGYVASWNIVENAVGYVVVINGATEYFVENNTSKFMLDENFSNVKIKAVGAGNYLDSDYSNVVNK